MIKQLLLLIVIAAFLFAGGSIRKIGKTSLFAQDQQQAQGAAIEKKKPSDRQFLFCLSQMRGFV